MSDPAVLNEITRCESWLFTMLSSDPTIVGIVGNRIYADAMPQEVTTYPALVFQFASAMDDLETGGPYRVWSRLIYFVKGITDGRSKKVLQTLMDRVDQVLYAARGGVTGTAIDYCRRKRPFSIPIVENNKRYFQVGAEWEIALRAQ